MVPVLLAFYFGVPLCLFSNIFNVPCHLETKLPAFLLARLL